MKCIILTNDDYKLFDEEVDLGQNEFMQENLGAWEQMFREQGQPFWLHFLICYRSFTLNCGFANNPESRVYFPLCKSKLRRLVDDVSIIIHREFVEASFNEVRKTFNDIVIVVKNRHLIPHLGSRCREKDPLYHKDTKNAYRDLFYEAGYAATAWKVAVGLPFYLKFAGAICNILKKWIQEKTLTDEELNDTSKNSYWTIPSEWLDKDFKPGVFEQYLSKFWGKKLIEVLNIDMCEQFSQKLNCDPCYLDVLTCECDNSYAYGTDDITESTSASTRKVAHKPSGSCRIRSDLLPSEITNTIAQAQKVHDAKERLRRKLGKKLRNKGEESSAMCDDCVSDSDWRLKLLEKAEKQFKKESKTTQKKAENTKIDGEKQDKISTKTKQLELKEHSCVSVKICTDVTVGQGSVTLSAGKASQKQTRAKAKRLLDKTKTVEEKTSAEGKGDQANTTISSVKVETITYPTDDDQIPKASNSLSGKDELSKDLEDIGDNLDSLEKSIKETGGLDFEEFKLLLETGRLLMKESNKSINSESSQRVKNKSSTVEPQTVATKFHVCAQCMKKESAPKIFKKCSRCKLEKFTAPRYYCSKKCQVEDWEESHRDEHLRASTHKV